MSKKRNHYSPEEKVVIHKKHLVERVPVSDICDAYDLHPTVFYRWQKEFFENGAEAFRRKSDGKTRKLAKKVSNLEEKLSKKNDVLAELMEEPQKPYRKETR
jgi:transposase-like protein